MFKLKITKGHNLVKNAVRVIFLISAHPLIMFYICTMFHKNISKGLSVIEGTRFSY